MPFLNPNVVRSAVEAAGNHAFYVEFIKRTTREPRAFTCRLHVKKGVTGALKPGVRKAEDLRNECLTVYALNEQSFKRIPLDLVTRICFEGQDISA